MPVWDILKRLFQDDPAEFVFKEDWKAYLKENLPLYSRFPSELREKLHEKIGQFVATTFFEGCGGLELTNEIILTVSGQACALIVNHEGAPYPNLKSVLIYPSAYSSVQKSWNETGAVTEERVTRLGESWSNGTVVLAWDSVARGAHNIFDGRNVAFHEFAHQLDQEDGSSDGTPFLHSSEAYQTWGAVLSEGYDKLWEKTNKGRKSFLDPYGATNHAEYFAVATEAFFEKPRQMAKKRPELYEELKSYYRLDPREWQSRPA